MFSAGTYSNRRLKWVVDMTIGYPENKTFNLQTAMMGTRKPFVITVHYRKFPIEDVPLETDALTRWVYKRFEEKEEMLSFFYEHGRFPAWDEKTMKVDLTETLEPRPVMLSSAKMILLNVFYLLVATATWNVFFSPFVTFKTGILLLGACMFLMHAYVIIGNFFIYT